MTNAITHAEAQLAIADLLQISSLIDLLDDHPQEPSEEVPVDGPRLLTAAHLYHPDEEVRRAAVEELAKRCHLAVYDLEPGDDAGMRRLIAARRIAYFAALIAPAEAARVEVDSTVLQEVASNYART